MEECFAKVIVFIVNVVFLLIALCVLIFGIITLSSPNTTVNVLNSIPGFQNINYVIDVEQAILNSAVLLIVVGAIIIVICITGIVSSCTRRKWLIITYIGLVLLVLFFELAIQIYAAVDSQFAESRIQSLMYTSLITYFIPVQMHNGQILNETTNGSTAWNILQFKYGCCGAYNYTDYRKFDWQTRGNDPYNYTNAIVPPSCCEQILQYRLPVFTKQLVDLDGCMYSAPRYTNLKGCYEVLLEFFFLYGYVIIIVVAILVAVEVVVSILSFRLLQTQENDIKSCSRERRRRRILPLSH